MRLLRILTPGLLLAASLAASPARAETYHTCAGFIDSLPAVISTQGVWCLRQDLSTAIASGNAITIASNNVTIDCNDFKIGGLAAGDSSTARGISAVSRQNATVRHCNVRGFLYGIDLVGGAGHLVEDNRLDNNLYYGIRVIGDNNRVRRNAVYDTGGRPGNTDSYGISAAADIIDNTVDGVFATTTNTAPKGISATGVGNEVRGNRIRGLVVAGGGFAIGVYVNSRGMTVVDNRIVAPAEATVGWGIYGVGAHTACAGNTVIDFTITYHSCEYSVGNLTP